MNDYTTSIIDLSSAAQKKIIKDIGTYTDSYTRKIPLNQCYDRHLSYFDQGRKLPFSKEDFVSSFNAKNFWADLKDCGSWIEFRHYIKSDKTKLHHANFCKRDKLCIACAVRRAYKQQLKFMSIIEEDQSLKDREWFYIVIPVKHKKSDTVEFVQDLVDDLRKKMTKSMRNARMGKHSNFWATFLGGMYAEEITKTKNGNNIHLNLLVNAPKGTVINLKEHRQVWNGREKISYSNADLSSWLKRFNGSYVHNISKISFNDQEELRGHLVEVLKYSLKFSDLTNQDLLEVFVKTRKKRLFGTFGNLWGKGLETVDLDGDTILDEDFVELIFTRTFKDGFPDYELYKREVKSVEKKEAAELVHTFGIVIPKIAEHKKYYNSAPMIMINQGHGRFAIKAKC